MNNLQEFLHSSNNEQALARLLGDNNQGHDKTQLQFFILERNGITDFGQYRQALRELNSRYEGLKTIYIDIEKAKAQIVLLEAEIAKLDKADPVQKAQADIKRIEIVEQRMKIDGYEKSSESSLREFKFMFAAALTFEKSIEGKDREQLEKEFWTENLRRQLAMNTVYGGLNLSGVMDTIHSLPKEMREPLLNEYHSLMITMLQNRDTYLLEVGKRKELPKGNA